MRFRKLRIAWSVCWGLAAVLLVVLWVRSYLRVDTLQSKTQLGTIAIRSVHGRLIHSRITHPSRTVALEIQQAMGVSKGGTFSSRSANDWHSKETTGRLGFGSRQVTKYQTELIVPLWFPALITRVVAGLPWIGKARRFSLRTLLIATTLVAVVLGLAKWLP